MSEARKYAQVFLASADGVKKTIDRWSRAGHYQIGDMMRLEAIESSHRSIGEMFAKIAEAESPRPWTCPEFGVSCGGAMCPGESKHTPRATA